MRILSQTLFSVCLILSIQVLTFSQSDFPSTFPDPAGKIETKYDRFEDKTAVTLRFLGVAHTDTQWLYINADSKYDGQLARKHPDSVTLVFQSISLLGYAYPEICKLDALVDGKPLSLGNFVRLDARIFLGKYVETIGKQVDYETFVRLAKAKTLEMRFNKTEFKLNEKQIEMLGLFTNLLWVG
jgi:hypothetical protein